MTEPCSRCDDCSRCRPIVSSHYVAATDSTYRRCRFCHDEAVDALAAVDVLGGLG